MNLPFFELNEIEGESLWAQGSLYQELKRFKLRCLLDIQIQILVGSLIDESGV